MARTKLFNHEFITPCTETTKDNADNTFRYFVMNSFVLGLAITAAAISAAYGATSNPGSPANTLIQKKFRWLSQCCGWGHRHNNQVITSGHSGSASSNDDDNCSAGYNNCYSNTDRWNNLCGESQYNHTIYGNRNFTSAQLFQQCNTVEAETTANNLTTMYTAFIVIAAVTAGLLVLNYLVVNASALRERIDHRMHPGKRHQAEDTIDLLVTPPLSPATT